MLANLKQFGKNIVWQLKKRIRIPHVESRPWRYRLPFLRKLQPYYYKRPLKVKIDRRVSLKELRNNWKQRRKESKKYSRKLVPRFVTNFFAWFNELSNIQVGFLIVCTLAVIFYFVSMKLTPPIQATSEEVNNIINFWNVKMSASGALTVGLIIHRIFVSSWDRYQKKPQGKIGQ